MSSARFIGRVGGLAVALGVGVAVFDGSAVAWADSPSTGSSSPAENSTHSASPAARSPKHGDADAPKSTTVAREAKTRSVTGPRPVERYRTLRAEYAEARPVSTLTARTPRTSSAARITAAESEPSVGTNPVSPAESPMSLALLAFTRRESAAATVTTSLTTAAVPVAAPQDTAVIMSPSGVPIVKPNYLAEVFALYVAPNSPAGTVPEGLDTPEGLYPITGVKSLPLNTSVEQGLEIFGTEIQHQFDAGNSVTVFGYSQSAIIASLAMDGLDPSLPISFILVGNEMNPNGGLLSRFPGLRLPSLGLDFYGATPPDAFPTTNYTLEYDGFADFPRYPLNFLADLNAGLGIIYVHTQYANLTQNQVTPVSQGGQAIELPTTSPTQRYYIIPTANLPLLEPLRAVPLLGTPLADLLQPALRVIVNLGYGDPKYGWSNDGYANVATSFGFLPDVDWGEVASLLLSGAEQGISDFAGDLRPGGSISRELASVTLPSLDDVVTDLGNLPTRIAYTISNATAAAYAVLLPTADIVNALVTMLPAYDLTLFLSGISQAASGDVIDGLLNAVGLPIAATVGLVTTAGLIELLVIGQGVEGILNASSYSDRMVADAVPGAPYT
ncbi:hypothetical protein BH09ACT7_BH09ACT7_03870 [soil metagenome]